MEELLDPQEMYAKQIKNQYKETAEKYFDELVAQSQMNVEENRTTVKKYDDTMKIVNEENKKYKGAKALKGFVIFLIVLFFAVAIVGIVFYATKTTSPSTGISMFVGGSVVAIFFIVLLVKVINKKVNARKAELDRVRAIAQQYLNQANAQMQNLNALFDWSAPSVISKRVTPIIQLDALFDNEKYGYLFEKYGFTHSKDNDNSIVGVVSGSILGNPFLLYRTLNQKMIMKTYTGSITISWTETVRDSQGNVHTQHRTQTLTASVDKPAPTYFNNTELVYGNEVAPKLNFFRKPSKATNMSDKEIERLVKKGAKKLDKKVRDHMTDNDSSTNFTAMTNTKFDVLFGALDRDNEAQFRLLFTPLAQNSMVNLIENGEPYGDDFFFLKRGPLNYIASRHSQNQDYSSDPNNYVSYSVDISKTLFVNYNCQYLESLFFDLAPLLCIPLYQQYKPKEYIYGDIFKTNYTPFEEESIANALDGSHFLPNEAITNQILKVTGTRRVGKTDIATITSYAFRGEDRVDYKTVVGGDGHTHTIAVHWIEYFPVEKNTDIAVKNLATTKNTYFSNYTSNNKMKDFLNSKSVSTVFQRGVVGMVLLGSYLDKDDIMFDSLFSKSA